MGKSHRGLMDLREETCLVIIEAMSGPMTSPALEKDVSTKWPFLLVYVVYHLGCGFAVGNGLLFGKCGAVAGNRYPDDSARPPFPPVFGPSDLRQMTPLPRSGVPLLFKVEIMTFG